MFGKVIAPDNCVYPKQLVERLMAQFKCSINVPALGTAQDFLLFGVGKHEMMAPKHLLVSKNNRGFCQTLMFNFFHIAVFLFSQTVYVTQKSNFST